MHQSNRMGPLRNGRQSTCLQRLNQLRKRQTRNLNARKMRPCYVMSISVLFIVYSFHLLIGWSWSNDDADQFVFDEKLTSIQSNPIQFNEDLKFVKSDWDSLQVCKSYPDTFEYPINIMPHGQDFTHVMVPSFPSSGSTWFKTLVNNLSGARDLGFGITCDIYGGTKNHLGSFKHQNLWCPDANSGHLGAVTIKTHFPRHESVQRNPFNNSFETDASMSFDKVLLLVRDPVTTVASVNKRWGKGIHVDQYYCWAAYWERVRVKMQNYNPGNFMFLRYEDLCSDTINTMIKVFDFMGIQTSRDEVVARFAVRPNLKCKHADDMRINANSEMTKQLLNLWGYDLESN